MSGTLTPFQYFQAFCEKYELAGFLLKDLIVEYTEKTGYKKKPVPFFSKEKDGVKWGFSDTEYAPGKVLTKNGASSNGFCIRTGECSNRVIGIDCDSEEAKDIITTLYPELNETLSIKTKKGFHFYVRISPKDTMLRNTTAVKEIHKDIDIRGEDGFLFAPPSYYESEDGEYKGNYKIHNKNKIQIIPNELYEILLKRQPQPEPTKIPMQSTLETSAFGNPRTIDPTPDPVRPPSPSSPKIAFSPVALKPLNVPPETHYKPIVPIQQLRELIALLPEDYTENYSDFIKIMSIIKHETKASEEGFRLAVETCRRPKKYRNEEESKYRSTWDSLRNTRATMGTLLFIIYGLGHTKQEVRGIIQKNSQHLGDNDAFLKVVWFSTEENIADYLAKEWAGRFMYCPKTGWWSLRPNNTWKNSRDSPEFIRTLTKEAFYPWIEYFLAEEKKKPEAGEEEPVGVNGEQNPDFVKELNSLKHKLGMNKIYNGIDAFLKEKMTIMDLDKKLDCKTNLFAFENGVYDSDTDDFREISPYDYITHTAGYDYEKHDEETLKTLEDKLKEIITPEHYDYVITLLCMGLNGNRRKPEIGCFTGVGANGKTVLITLMKSIFGDMFSPEPVGLFTGKEISPRNPELLTLRGKRMVVIEEPARESALSSLIKMLEGATIKARDNYARSSDFIEFLPTFGLFMCFNDAPKFPGDGGVRRRIRAIRFPMRFCDSPKEDFERKADPMIKENFRNNPIWRNAGFEILRRKYVAFRESGYTLTTPPGILETSSEVIDSGNDIVDWFNRYYEKTNVDSDRVIKGNLYEHYRSTTMSGAFSQQKFSKLIGDYQIPTKCSNGIRYFVGVKLRETKPETSECDITE